MPKATDKPKRRWQFSLRKLFIVVALVCVFFGTFVRLLVVPEMRRQAYQRKWAELGVSVSDGASCDEEVTELYLTNACPPEIRSLTNVRFLYFLDGSQLTTLPPEIRNLTNLTVLYAHEGSQLTTLPPEIGSLRKLTGIYLDGCHLNTLPPVIGNLTNLTRLNLMSNPITNADLLHLKSLTHLEYLDLRGTNVTEYGVEHLQRALPNCRIQTRGVKKLKRMKAL